MPADDVDLPFKVTDHTKDGHLAEVAANLHVILGAKLDRVGERCSDLSEYAPVTVAVLHFQFVHRLGLWCFDATLMHVDDIFLGEELVLGFHDVSYIDWSFTVCS